MLALEIIPDFFLSSVWPFTLADDYNRVKSPTFPDHQVLFLIDRLISQATDPKHGSKIDMLSALFVTGQAERPKLIRQTYIHQKILDSLRHLKIF